MYKSYRLKKAHDEPFLRKNTVLIYHITAIQNPPPNFKYWWCDSLRVARCELRGKKALEVTFI